MGNLLPQYNKILIDEILNSISSNTSHYYAFAANPIEYSGSSPAVANSDYGSTFENNWLMLFGKKITTNDIAPVIEKNIWVSGSIYTKYDNTSNTLHSNSNFYVITEPEIVGGNYNIYKCIDNSNNSVSTVNPSLIDTPTQPTTFETDDGYKWRYITSVSYKNYEKFATDDYVPVYTNNSLSVTSSSRAGVDVVVITNNGIGYDTYHSGNVLSVAEFGSRIQIENSAAAINDYYVNNSIYLYNTTEVSTAELLDIYDYVANSSGRWIYVTPNSNITTSGTWKYNISPKVAFETDGDSQPKAYTTINTTSNSINSIVILDPGSNISRANVSIQSNTTYGTGATVYAIVPPAGGHGYDPATELNVKGLSINFKFSNTESNTITTSNLVFNKIGLLKNPYSLEANVSTGTISKGSRFSSNTFDQMLLANVSTVYTFTVGETVVGNTSTAKGIVALGNTSQVYLVGDKHFIDGEYIKNSNGTTISAIEIQQSGQIYNKDLSLIYIDNINNINRSDEQTEEFKLTIKT